VTADAGSRRDANLAAIGATQAFPGQIDVRIDARESLGAHPFAPPTVPNTWAAREGHEWLWLGPDEWLVIVNGDPGPTIARLEAALEQTHHSVVDVSAARAVFELAGRARRELLAASCGLDLHPRAWREGMCAQTLLGRVPVVLQELELATRVLVRPSYADALLDLLVVSAGPA
jgi:sarcosine oxidase subunit gamma